MKLKLNKWTKISLVLICLISSVIGFMVKLPSGFRHIDKELHTVFYFLAAALLNILFTKGKLAIHILIFAILYLFGICIEYVQEYSNRFFQTRIHGRYDPEDIRYNLRGLIGFSAIWICYWLIMIVYRRQTLTEATNKQD